MSAVRSVAGDINLPPAALPAGMQVPFVKMHGLGNDFMVVEWPEGVREPDPERVRRWADRRRGVGFDSLLLLSTKRSDAGAARYRVLNADGGEAQQCGNGARCLASFLAGEACARLTLISAAGPVEARVLAGGQVSINLGEPNFEPAALPFEADARRERYVIDLEHGRVEIGAVSMGNPHAVIEVGSVDAAPVGILGPQLAAHPAFPEGVNVGFMQLESRERVRLRVFERGVGETLACGTGAAAAVAVGRLWGQLADDVEVQLPGGVLRVAWPGPGQPLWQTGQTTKVYEGRIEL
jgi:diaminopimelate epimerase